MKITPLRALSMGLASALAGALGAAAEAAAPAGRYTISVGSVYDARTKLTWQRSAPTTPYTWDDAKAYCASGSVGAALGGTGWRLPTEKELLTLVDYSVPPPGPTIDAAAFPGTPGDAFWSTTPVTDPHSGGGLWYVDFSTGHAIGYAVSPTSYVRCVR